MDFNIRNYGAVGDGVTLDTAAIQKAIDAAASLGGRVVLEGGTFKSGTLFLKSSVELHIEGGATLLCSDDFRNLPELPDYKNASAIDMPMKKGRALIIADGCEGASLTGTGTVNMSGDAYYERKCGEFEGWSFKRCHDDIPRFGLITVGAKNFRVENLTFTNIPSACWTFWILDSDIVDIRGVKILANLDVPHCDGIHINSSRDVHVEGCTVKTGDDALIVRANNSSLRENKVCERVTVTNCTVTSYSAGIRVGWVRDGIIRNCSFSNIVMTDTTCGVDIYIPADYPECSDRGRESTLVENLTFSNITMDEMYGKPVKIHVMDSESTYCEGVRNLTFDGIKARALELPLIAGKRGCPVENIVFSNCRFTKVAENAFPKNKKFHGPAAWSATSHTAPDMVYHAKNVTFSSTVFDNE